MNLFLFVMLYVYHSDNFCTLTNLLSYPPPPRIILFSNKRYIPSSPTSIKYVAISFLSTPPPNPFNIIFITVFRNSQQHSYHHHSPIVLYCSLQEDEVLRFHSPLYLFFFSFNLIDTKKMLPSINCVALKRKK